MKILLILTALLLSFKLNAAPEIPVFRFHLATEPTTLDPIKQRTSASSYLQTNLHRNLLTYDNDKGLIPDLAEKCVFKKLTLTCTLKKDLKWSDGSRLSANDFLETYKKILSPANAIPRADLLFKIKNAEKFYQGQVEFSAVGISSPTKDTLKFELSEVFPEFEFYLTSTNLAPSKSEGSIGTGPYRLVQWIKGQKFTLEPNPFYWMNTTKKPLVEVLFIEEDSVALQLYEKNQLSLLRRLPTLFIPSAKSRPDFYWVPALRFDYLGFGPELKDQEDLRKAFTYSLNYPELQKIFSSVGAPGCVGIPDAWFPKKAPCFEFDPKKIPETKSTKNFKMTFSSLGGDDHRRATEWMQDQWKKNAKLNVELEGKENKAYLAFLKQNPSAIFRKGIGLERPTCLAALENFGSTSAENFIGLKDMAFDKILEQLAAGPSEKKKKELCQKGVDFLMSRHLIIPLGPIQFAILAKPTFGGWKLNQMNQLDLSQLRSSP